MTTTDINHRTGRPGPYMLRTRLMGTALLMASLGACSDKSLLIANPNAPTITGAASDPAAFQLQATGLLTQYRATRTGYINDMGRFGRESYVFTPQEPRNTSHYFIGISVGGIQQLDPSGFASGQWAGQYTNLRDIFNFKNAVPVNASLNAAQKAAALGFAKTIEAAELLEVIATRDTLGAITEIKANPAELAPFVSRDSVYKYILATLDGAATNLAAGGSSFPFALHSGFTGFNTPATFALFTQALKARAAAYYATEGGGASYWTTASTALAASFLNGSVTTRAALDAGVYDIYSTAPGDINNTLSQATNTDLYAHMSIQADAQKQADGTTPDLRYTTKIRTAATRLAPQNLAASSSLGFSIWPSLTTPIPIIRNEELILLRAEARLATGDKAGAIADINTIRTVSGGLAPTPLTAAATSDEILTELLYNKRYSLLMEGHRWVDLRRYGRLNTLPLDITTGTNTHFVPKVMPIPQAECLQRAPYPTGNLHGPGC